MQPLREPHRRAGDAGGVCRGVRVRGALRQGLVRAGYYLFCLLCFSTCCVCVIGCYTLVRQHTLVSLTCYILHLCEYDVARERNSNPSARPYCAASASRRLWRAQPRQGLRRRADLLRRWQQAARRRAGSAAAAATTTTTTTTATATRRKASDCRARNVGRPADTSPCSSRDNVCCLCVLQMGML